MTSYQPGDTVLIAFPYSSGKQAKLRPALVLLDSGDADVLVARITTNLAQTAYDVPLADWQLAGLLAPSVVRLNKLATLEKALIQRALGHIEPSDRQQVANILHRMYGNW